MAHWNHRVWKETDEHLDVRYSIRETYYNNAGEICAVSEGISAAETYQWTDESEEDCLNVLKNKLVMLSKAVDNKVLDYDNFVFAPMGENGW